MSLTFTPKASSGSGERTPAGEYLTTLKEIVNEGPGQHNPNVERLKFVFTINAVSQVDEYPDSVDPDDEDATEEFEGALVGRDHFEWVNFTMGPNATLRQWLSWMLGKPVEDSVDESAVLGKQYRITIGWKNYVIQSTGQSGSKLTITNIRPIRRTAKPKPAPVVADDEEWLDTEV